jgi:hypothetical protein
MAYWYGLVEGCLQQLRVTVSWRGWSGGRHDSGMVIEARDTENLRLDDMGSVQGGPRLGG